MRRRFISEKQLKKVVKEMDVFPKVDDSYQETTKSGGTVSILCFVLIAILVWFEVGFFTDTYMTYEYVVDMHTDDDLMLNVDITVSMPCKDIGADVYDTVDSSIQSMFLKNGLKDTPTYFEMDAVQKVWHKTLLTFQDLRVKDPAIQDVMYKSAIFNSTFLEMPKRNVEPTHVPDACRIKGSQTVKRLAGNFHITVGKAIPHPKSHAHLTRSVNMQTYNFSHRIDQLSFGNRAGSLISPLDGVMKVAETRMVMYQYFMKIVPTEIDTKIGKISTHQYSVTEQDRTIDHSQGSHGIPGVFFKYDLTPMKIRVREEHRPYWKLFVRLCGIVGGIFATVGMFHSFISFLISLISPNQDTLHQKEQKPYVQLPISTDTMSLSEESVLPSLHIPNPLPPTTLT